MRPTRPVYATHAPAATPARLRQSRASAGAGKRAKPALDSVPTSKPAMTYGLRRPVRSAAMPIGMRTIIWVRP
nr:hypothetical protein [Ferroacidibacillus organovorans]